MTRRFLQLLLLAALAAALAAPAAFAQATGATGADGKDAPAPTAVEPAAGQPAPAPADPAPAPAATVVPAVQPTTAAPATTPVVPAGASGAVGPQAAKAGGGGLSNGTLAGIAAVALLVVILSLIVFAESRGWSSRRLDRWRHAAGEANWRISLRAAEFRDFLRLGR
jgi:hypothetical protein